MIEKSFRQYLGAGPGDGNVNECLVVGEVAQAHDGSLGMAHAFIDAIADSKADAVKFQTHIAAAESTLDEPWRVKFSWQDKSRYDYWKRMEFTEIQWLELKRHAEDRGLLFLSSPFSVAAVDLLKRLGVTAWKVASGEVNNPQLLQRIIETGQPVILSTGMSSLSEIDEAVRKVKAAGNALAVLQCTSSYPCSPERIGLNLISFFRDRYASPAGLSDHSGTIYPGLAAATLGIEVLEVHVTLSKAIFGPDVPVSITTGELCQLVDGIRFIERMRASPLDKNEAAAEVTSLRALFTKSVVAATDLPAGRILRGEDLTVKKPGSGIPAGRLTELLGARLRRSLKVDELLHEEDVEGVE
jgi:N,N'-diacetyllegionaminate synthase